MPTFNLKIIHSLSGKPFAECNADVLIKVRNDAASLTSVTTDGKGNSKVDIDDRQLESFLQADPAAFIYFRVYKGTSRDLLKDTRDTIQWLPNDPAKQVTIPVETDEDQPSLDYTLSGYVRDISSGLPLDNLTVKAFVIAGDREKEFASSQTDEKGAFHFKPDLAKPILEGDVSDKAIIFRIYKERQDTPVAEGTAVINWGSNLQLAATIIEADLTPELDTLGKKLGWNLSPELVALLESKNIRTLEDVRKTGGLSREKEIPQNAREQVELLEAHSRLNVLPSTTLDNNKLVELGFNSVNSILAYNEEEFVARLGDTMPAEKAKDIYIFSHAYTQNLYNAMTAYRTFALKNKNKASDSIDDIFPISCDCDECQHAASPTAYLVDLLNYAIDHLRNNSAPVNLTWLEQRFHQPFRKLPVDCKSQKELVRQVRICIEVLRDLLPAPSKIYQSLPYLESVYRQFLELYGTSYEEIRELRAMKDEQKKEAAERLQLPWMNAGAQYTEELYRSLNDAPGSTPESLSEEWLEITFGVPDTTKPPPPGLLPNKSIGRFGDLRLQFWFMKWQEEDTDSATYALGDNPLLDPDNINITDVVAKPQYPIPANKWNWNEGDFLDRRRYWIDLVATSLDQYRVSAPAKSFNDMLVALSQANTIPDVATAVMNGITVADLLTERVKADSGENIDAWLSPRKLSTEVFYRLSDFARLENRNLPISNQEWKEFYDIVIRQAKLFEVNNTWRMEEFRKDGFNNTNPFTITSKYFKTDIGADPAVQWTAKLWRSDPDARKNIQQVLKSRTGIEQVINEQAKNAVDTVEGSSLVNLRDELLRAAANLGLLTGSAGSLITRERLKWFVRHFQVDGEQGGYRTTTRVEQAIETLQGVLNGARMGLLEDLSITLNNLETFDLDWLWIGSYSTWKAAMMVFLYPENTLRPTLRRRQSPGFRKLIDELRNAGSITPQSVKPIVADYDQYFTDLCNLKLTGTCKGTELGTNSKLTNWNYFLAASSVTGNMYFSFTDEWDDPSHWYPVQLPELSSDHSEIVSYGLTLFMPNDRERFLYIFAGSPATGVPLGFSRCNLAGANDLGDLRWSLLTPLALPNEAKNMFKAAVTSASPFSPPELIVALTPTQTYFRRLNEIASAWSAADFIEAALPKSWISLGKFSCTALPGNTTVKPSRIVTGDFDGDGFDELVIVPEARAPDYNDIWIMKYVNNAWQHLSPMNGSALEADLRCAPGSAYFITDVLAGDFDGDGRDELIVTASYALSGNPGVQFSFWMYKYNANGTWTPLGARSREQDLFAYKDESYTFYISSELARVGDFNGDGTDELAFKVYSPGVSDIKSQNSMWIFKYDKATTVWSHETITLDLDKNMTIKDVVVMDFDKDGKDEILALKYGPDNTIGNNFWNAQIKDDLWKITDDDLDCSNEAISINYPLRGSFDGLNNGIAARQEKNDKYWVFHKSFGTWQGLPVLTTGPFKYYFALDIDGDLRDEIVEVQDDLRIAIYDWAGNAWTKFSPASAFGKEAFAYSNISGAKGRFTDKAGIAEQFVYWTPGNTENTLGVAFIQTDLSLFTPASPLFEKLKPAIAVAAPIYKNKDLPALRKTMTTWNAQALAILSTSLPPVKDYLEEMFYFLPVEIALRLNQERSYTESFDWFRLVFDYALPVDQRRISFKLILETDYSGFFRTDNWIQDPLQPHLIAEMRSPAYTRYTLLSLIRCLLDDADAEFTRATSESLALAMNLYLKALELLEAAELNFRKSPCADLIGRFQNTIGDDETTWVRDSIIDELNKLEDIPILQDAISRLEPILHSQKNALEKWTDAKLVLEEVYNKIEKPTLEEKLIKGEARKKDFETLVAADFDKNINGVPVNLNTRAKKRIIRFHQVVTPAPLLSFGIPPNPLVETLRKRAEVNLVKLRTGRNIAGLPLNPEPYSSPTVATASSFDQLPAPLKLNLRPLPYRYGTLIERTKQMVELAWQLEQSMLQNITAAEQEKYQILKARQDLGLADAAVQLRNLQIGLAEHGVTNSSLQVDKAIEQFDHYNKLVSSGLSFSEQASLAALTAAAVLKGVVGAMYVAAGAIPSADSILSFGASNASNIASGMSSLADSASTASSVFSSVASFDRRRQEWIFNRQTSKSDVTIARAQNATAWAEVKIANQEKDVAVLQTVYAEQVLDYLTIGKFLNYDLYEWMSSVIEGIYHFFLQQATAMAQLAENQLAFERQEVMPAFIKADYWEPVSENQSSDSSSQANDRRGLTGSARLLRDIYELDQYAFRTNQRKLQLTETFSLLQLDPVVFNQFKETGVLNFDTPMSLFNSKFPGHYLRLIKKIRISVIALVPPVFGIRATLANIGSSKVALGPDNFEIVDIRRDAESISFTSPITATGLFELDSQPELLVPFEGIGVDSRWQFEMPKAANPFDYDTIADVLFTVEYTALSSYDYRNEVIKKLPGEITADRVYSFRNNLADAWYDLSNADLTETPMKVKFRTTASDFPSHIIKTTLNIDHITLYFAKSDNGNLNPALQVALEFTEKDGNGNTIGGQAVTTNGILSTKSGNAAAWNSMIRKDPSTESIELQTNEVIVHPYREWELTLPDDAATKKLFKEEKIKDILLVITYSGDLPKWPV